MSAINRRPIFQAVKALRKGQGFTLDEVRQLDAAIDAAFAGEAPSSSSSASTSPSKPLSGLRDGAAFFAHLKAGKLLGPTLSQNEVDGCTAITSACAAAGWPISWTAYAMATAYHETVHTMLPIKEMGGSAYYTRLYDIGGRNPDRARKMGNTAAGDGCRYCGRGYVQLTWKSNYAKAGQALGADLVGQPDLAMKPDIAAAIMVRGMQEGWFTGKKLAHYLPSGSGTAAQFKDARRIINGTDKDSLIAAYAVEFQKALGAGKWGA